MNVANNRLDTDLWTRSQWASAGQPSRSAAIDQGRIKGSHMKRCTFFCATGRYRLWMFGGCRMALILDRNSARWLYMAVGRSLDGETQLHV